ncbi:MAG: 50S ribosomal protein L19 [Candidatus Babeliales bacterium]|nr:50S ribosomal protein L19 [Candidatus Babeliales bacterium]
MKSRKITKETVSELGIYKRDFPKFSIGDTIAISQRIKEGDKERLQVFQGDVIAMNNNGASSTFTVRKIAANTIAVERIFPYYSPIIASIEAVKKGKVRRAKLYYLRKRVGKSAKIQELILTKEQKEHKLAQSAAE